MEKHPGTRRNHWLKALLTGGMLLGGAFLLRTGVTLPAQAATPQAPARAAKPYVCKPLVRVQISFAYKDLVQPDPFNICQDHGPKGHYKLIWKKAPHVKFETFTATFTRDQYGNCPFVDARGKDQCVFSFGHGSPSITTPGHTKALGLTAPRQFKYSVKVCRDVAETDCDERDPGGIIQP